MDSYFYFEPFSWYKYWHYHILGVNMKVQVLVPCAAVAKKVRSMRGSGAHLGRRFPASTVLSIVRLVCVARRSPCCIEAQCLLFDGPWEGTAGAVRRNSSAGENFAKTHSFCSFSPLKKHYFDMTVGAPLLPYAPQKSPVFPLVRSIFSSGKLQKASFFSCRKRSIRRASLGVFHCFFQKKNPLFFPKEKRKKIPLFFSKKNSKKDLL